MYIIEKEVQKSGNHLNTFEVELKVFTKTLYRICPFLIQNNK